MFHMLLKKSIKHTFVEHENSISIHKAIIEPIMTTEEDNNEELQIGERAVKIISEIRKYKSERNLSLKEVIESVSIQIEKEMDFGDAIDDIKSTCSCKTISIEIGSSFAVSVE